MTTELMIEEITGDLTAEMERKSRWNRFLDAYSAYMQDWTMTNAAILRLAGNDLEQADDSFSMDDFESRLGWNAGL